MASPGQPCRLSVVIPALDEAENLAELLPQIHTTLAEFAIAYEIVIVDERANARTRDVAARHRATLLSPASHGYGAALRAGFQHAAGDYIITMDADQSHPPALLRDLWAARAQGEIVIASRYVAGGRAEMPWERLVLSRVLNLLFSRGLDLRVRDMSSGFRLYRASVVRQIAAVNRDFDFLQELLVKALMAGYRIAEIPFAYQPRRHGATHARVIQFGLAYLRTFRQLWRQRNSVASADYDARAHDSAVPPQRYWQRRRYRHITQLLAGQPAALDVGCGSSRIIAALPPGSLALDISARKLRYARRYQRALIQGSALTLPIQDQAFGCVVCSQVIEHIPRARVLDELDRVLQPGGRLILGTPDYANWQWRWIEWIYKTVLPNAYADEHITHYTRAELLADYVEKRGYQLEVMHYILRGELILGLRKPGGPAGPPTKTGPP